MLFSFYFETKMTIPAAILSLNEPRHTYKNYKILYVIYQQILVNAYDEASSVFPAFY